MRGGECEIFYVIQLNDFAVAVMHGDRTIEQAEVVKSRIQKYIDLTSNKLGTDTHVYVHLVLVPTVTTGDEFIRLMNAKDANERTKSTKHTAHQQATEVISRKTRKIKPKE